MACATRVVARQHDDALDAVRFQLLDHGHRVGAQYIGDGDGPKELSAAGAFVDVSDDHGCLSIVLQVAICRAKPSGREMFRAAK